jgi:hypothetical protein
VANTSTEQGGVCGFCYSTGKDVPLTLAQVNPVHFSVSTIELVVAMTNLLTRFQQQAT